MYLPFELWDIILRQLPDQELLIGARVCKAWNTICIEKHLQRSNISLASSSSACPTPTPLVLFAHQLRVVRLACCIPAAIPSLTVQFWIFAVHRDLADLLDLLRRTHMTELKVSFRSNVLRLSHAEALVKLVCGIVQAFCSQGRVGAGQLDAMGVLLRGELYPVHSTCLHTWGVRYERLPNDGWTYYAPPPRRKWSILKRLTSRGGNTSDKSALLSVRLDDRRVATVTHLEAFQLRWISSTAVEVNFEPDLKRFTIGADSDLEVYREILPRICLPVLETLSVELPLPLDVLAAFLANHRSLICLRLLSSLSGSPLAPDIQPLSLPHLSTITVADSAMLPLLFGLISIGPSPKSISVTLQRPLFTEDSAMSRPVLSTLAQLRPETHLSLDLWITLASARTADIPADLLELAAHTTCIHTLVVHAHAISAVRAIVPWVSALPSLRTLELRAPEPVDDVAVATCLRFVETRVRQRNVPLTVVYMEVVSPVSLAGNATVS